MSDNFEKDFQRFQGNIRKIATALNSRQVSIRLGRKIKEIVYRRVKSGFGVDNDSDSAVNVNRVKLKALSKSYIDYRKGLAIFFEDSRGNIIRIGAYGKAKKTSFTNADGSQGIRSHRPYNEKFKIEAPKLGAYGRPEKSNGTLSGQMLDAITIDAQSGAIRVYINSNTRRKVNPKSKSEATLTNKEVAEYYSAQRPFMALTDGEVRILRQECENILKETIAKLIRA